MATPLNATDINNLNASVYNIASTANVTDSIGDSNFTNSTSNNVSASSKVLPINVTNLQNAINILETSFSNNCCQANCNQTSTISSCQVVGGTSTVCQSSKCQSCQQCQTCQGCQSCQSAGCQSCQKNCVTISNCKTNGCYYCSDGS